MEVLAADPRSVHWRHQRSELEYGFSLDSLNVVVRFYGGVASVTQVQHIDQCDRSHAGGKASGSAGTPEDEFTGSGRPARGGAEEKAPQSPGRGASASGTA